MSDAVVCYIGLGSNLNNPRQQILTARAELIKPAHIEEIGFSSLYQSPPMGPQDQPHYINAAIAIRALLSAEDLLAHMQHIERDHGRIRNQRWGARTLDLDLLLYGDQRIDLPGQLHVPHPGIAHRAFVLHPLAELNPELTIPGLGPVRPLLEHCPLAGLSRLD
ncbi:MAG: 2-amino-4-hydroxy-6-hydroxymethyldihydropteridine diphosphokinase [Methylococcales bacterium]|nr:2-amino-4-hydroxy-6-hydroxymethyldihydropteridine diphosphokinase [Methylococcales bacterium]